MLEFNIRVCLAAKADVYVAAIIFELRLTFYFLKINMPAFSIRARRRVFSFKYNVWQSFSFSAIAPAARRHMMHTYMKKFVYILNYAHNKLVRKLPILASAKLPQSLGTPRVFTDALIIIIWTLMMWNYCRNNYASLKMLATNEITWKRHQYRY
jgi:hypothetical protein